MPADLKALCAGIKLLIADVDGVLTDGSVYKTGDGTEFKRFHIPDGAGVALAHAAGIKVALISGRFSETTAIRAQELHIDDVYNGTLNKINPYYELKVKYKLDDQVIAYLGDDLIDLAVMKMVGLPIAVRNAYAPVKELALFTTRLPGGKGAFREAVDWILQQRGCYQETVDKLQQAILEREIKS